MASLVLRKLGGMAPSANPTALPESGATFVQNLDLRFGDFRPLPVPASIGAATAGSTLYKLEGAAGFITRPGTVNFVRGPIPNDPTERTYYSGDGTPKVTDLSGAVRPLGVPQPSAAPVATLVAGAQFSEDDANAAKMKLLAEMQNIVRGNMTTPHYGPSDADLGAKFVTGVFGYPELVRFKIPGAMSGAAFTPTNPAHNNLNDMRLGFKLENVNGVVSAYSTLTVRAPGLAISGTMTGALLSMTHPITNAQLLKTEMAEGIVATVTESIKVPEKTRDECIVRMKALLAEYTTLADVGDTGVAAMRGQVEAFYAKPEINGTIEAAVTRAISSIIAGLKGYAGGGGGGGNETMPITGKPGSPGNYTNIP